MTKQRIDHETIIKGLIEYFQSKSCKILSANYEGYPKPTKIKRHIPDVTAIDLKTGLGYIAEAKMCDDLTNQITKEQFEDFPKRIMTSGPARGKNLPFVIGVPRECLSKIKEIYRNFEIPWRENIHPLGF